MATASDILATLRQVDANLNRVLAPRWNYASGVDCCPTCEGAGVVHAARRPTIDDPYPENACPDCDGERAPECPVCGFGQQIEGFDCLACDTIAQLYESHLAKLNIDAFAAALRAAQKKALAA